MVIGISSHDAFGGLFHPFLVDLALDLYVANLPRLNKVLWSKFASSHYHHKVYWLGIPLTCWFQMMSERCVAVALASTQSNHCAVLVNPAPNSIAKVQPQLVTILHSVMPLCCGV